MHWCAWKASYQLNNSVLFAAKGATATAADVGAVEFVVVVVATYQLNSAKTDDRQQTTDINSTGPKAVNYRPK